MSQKISAALIINKVSCSSWCMRASLKSQCGWSKWLVFDVSKYYLCHKSGSVVAHCFITVRTGGALKCGKRLIIKTKQVEWECRCWHESVSGTKWCSLPACLSHKWTSNHFSTVHCSNGLPRLTRPTVGVQVEKSPALFLEFSANCLETRPRAAGPCLFDLYALTCPLATVLIRI